jgi:hypothetical protein
MNVHHNLVQLDNTGKAPIVRNVQPDIIAVAPQELQLEIVVGLQAELNAPQGIIASQDHKAILLIIQIAWKKAAPPIAP